MVAEKKSWYGECSAGEWKDVLDLYGHLGFSEPSDEKNLWIFRAQKYREKPPLLSTKLEEAIEKFKPDEIRKNNKNLYSRSLIEKALIQEFQRKAALYIEHSPEQDDVL